MKAEPQSLSRARGLEHVPVTGSQSGCGAQEPGNPEGLGPFVFPSSPVAAEPRSAPQAQP